MRPICRWPRRASPGSTPPKSSSATSSSAARSSEGSLHRDGTRVRGMDLGSAHRPRHVLHARRRGASSSGPTSTQTSTPSPRAATATLRRCTHGGRTSAGGCRDDSTERRRPRRRRADSCSRICAGYSKFTDEHGDAAAAELDRPLSRAGLGPRSPPSTARRSGPRATASTSSFRPVSEAVQAGLAIRDAAATASAEPGATPIHVGIGIHAGESTDGSQGIVSAAVNIAARVCAVAEPGEVLVTDTVRSLTRSFLPIGFTAAWPTPAEGHRRADRALPPSSPSAAEQRPAARTRGPRFAIAGALLGGSRRHRRRGAHPERARGNRGATSGIAGGQSDRLRARRDATTSDDSRIPASSRTIEETALIEQLATGLTPSCDRADPSTYPGHYFAETVRRHRSLRPLLNIRAGITLPHRLDSATYLQVGSTAQSRNLELRRGGSSST